jgi:hypothetical protein
MLDGLSVHGDFLLDEIKVTAVESLEERKHVQENSGHPFQGAIQRNRRRLT